jgi:hypothetical protein
MRQLWTRASHPRRLLVVAAMSMITLAASSPIYAAARGGHLIGHTPDSPAAAPAATAATADCSKAAGLEVVQRLHLNDPEVTDPVYKVLCGSFTGPVSQTMVVSLMGPGSSGMLDWVVFSWAGDAWQLLMKRHQSAVLTAAGSDIRETLSIFRDGDSRCCPSGGTKARIWHWDGTSLVAGPWKQVTKGDPRPRYFYSPSHNIFCGMHDDSDYRSVFCQSWKSPQRVELDVNGTLKICQGRRCIPGVCGCREEAPTLGYGKQGTIGRFRCVSLQSGMRCTVIRSGKGFLINSKGVRRVGP